MTPGQIETQSTTPAPGNPAAAPAPAAEPTGPSRGNSPAANPGSHSNPANVQSSTPENKNKRINPSPEDTNASPSTTTEK